MEELQPAEVVLDACVLLPMTLRDTLLRIAEAGPCRPYWSEEILDVTEEQVQRLIAALNEAFPDALVTDHASLIAAMPNHPKDRHVLAVAVAVNAQLIITDNLRDFPKDLLAPLGIEAQSPDDFLLQLYKQDPASIIGILIEQARDLHNPPKTAVEVLDVLARHVPTFAARVRESLDL